FHSPHLDAGAEELRYIQDAARAWSTALDTIEFFVVLEENEVAGRLQNPLDEFDDQPRAHCSRVGDIINPKSCSPLGQIQTSSNRILEVRKRGYVVIHLAIALQLREEVAGRIVFVEGHPHTPNKGLCQAPQSFLRQCPGAFEEAARR